MRTAALVAVAAVLVTTGCGYRFVGAGERGGLDAPISVSVFDNRTAEGGLGLSCARALELELASVDLSAATGRDLAVLGAVEGISERPVAFALGTERQVEMEVSVRGLLVFRSDTAELLRTPFEGRTTYAGSGAPTAVDAERSAALELACKRAMRDSALSLSTELGHHDSAEETHGRRETGK